MPAREFRFVRELVRDLSHLLFPEPIACALCSEPVAAQEVSHFDPERWFCHGCLERVFLPATGRCRKCGYPAAGPGGFCRDCLRHPLPYDRAWSVGVYEGNLRRAIVRMKYNGQKSLALPLGTLMGTVLRQVFCPPDVVVPVPLHPVRLRERGYNQAELLARVICDGWGLPLVPGVLRRTESTAAQAGLDRLARMENVTGAFAVSDPVYFRGYSVLLVDDVYSTGATVGVCAGLLREAGARRVDAITLAVSGLA